MKVTIIGAGGNIGKRIVQEAANRNHKLNLITSKDLSFFNLRANTAEKLSIDIFDTKKLLEVFKKSDVVISAYAPPSDHSELLIEASKTLINIAKKTEVRLIAIGGAGSLQIAENKILLDSPEFPEAYKSIALAHKNALENIYISEKAANWTNVSPSAYIFEGERTNNFRIAEDNLLIDDQGQSAISMEDFAVGILNEVEYPKFPQKRFTIGY